ncbi:hypothetical protein, partial [Acinetobacter baumannii]|uniref:hypothetical protein n=1 Tax=Acinetobacter baumannii TaxID=470 RepID=UPI0013D512ED
LQADHRGWWAIETEGHDAVANSGDGDGNDNRCDVPVSDLRKWLSTHRDAIVSVDPFVFEKRVADCLKHHYPK